MKTLILSFLVMALPLAFCAEVQLAQYSDFHCQAGHEAKYKTEAKVWHDGKSLVFEIVCEQPKTTLVATSIMHDRDVYKDDSVEVYIDAAGQGDDYMQFIVNPHGTIQDLRFRQWDWDSEATAAAEVSENQWLVRLAVPLTDIAPFCNQNAKGDIVVRINICRSVQNGYYESLLQDGAYSKKEEFLPLTISGVGTETLKALCLERLQLRRIDTASFAKLDGEAFYKAAASAELAVSSKGLKELPEGVRIYFDSQTNVIPNPKFEYVNRRGKLANWLKRGKGEYNASEGVLEMKSDGRLELWQENEPFLDNTRRYSLRAKVKSVSGDNRFLVNLKGVDRRIKGLEINVAHLEGPLFKNDGEWHDVSFDFELPKSAFRGDAGICVENGTVYVKEIELDMLGAEDTEIIVSQLGYRVNGYKDAIVWSRKGGLSTDFELLKDGRSVFRGTAVRRVERNYGRETIVADFSSFNQEGTFQLKSNGIVSNSFKVGRDVYMNGIHFLLNGFYLQRQSVRQEGWKKKPDYMDDAFIVSDEVRNKDSLLFLPDGNVNPKYILGHRDLTGGWRDAGDDSKQPTDTASIYCLARVQRLLAPKWNTRNTKLPDLADELWWGCSRIAEKCYMGDGTFLYPNITVTKKSHWYGRAPEDCTDGIPGTPDDRIAFAAKTSDGGYKGSLCNQWIFFDTIGLTGIAIAPLNPSIAAKCRDVLAENQKRLREAYEAEGLAAKRMDRGMLTMRIGRLAYNAIYLYRLTNEQQYMNEADEMLRRVIKFVHDTDYNRFDMLSAQHSYQHYFGVMMEYAEFFPDSPLLPEIKKAVAHYIEHAILPGYDVDELFPMFDHRRLAKHLGRPLPNTGYNCDCTFRALTLLRAGRLLGRNDFVTLADKTLQFWMGRNPQGLCEVSGMGWRYSATMTGLSFCEGHEDGVVPGLMTNGFRRVGFMPCLSKPVNPVPGGNLMTAYGVETFILPNGYAIGLLGELERIYAEK